MSCELCGLVDKMEYKTHLYYRNKTVTIVDCLKCQIPMVVFNHHGEATELEERQAMSAINALFTYESISKEAKKIKDHDHWHLLGVKLKELR